MTKLIKMKWLPRLLEKITNINTQNNSEFTYYGYKVIMLSGTPNYTNVTIQDKKGNTTLAFTLDFLTLDCDIKSYNNVDIKVYLVNTLNELYNGKMKFRDQQLENELAFYEPMLGDEKYDQEYVQKIYDEIIKHKIN